MKSHLLKQAFAISGVALSVMFHGCAFVFPSVLIADFTDENGLRLNKHDISTIGSAIGYTKFCGSFLCPFLMEKIGRQKLHLYSVIPAITGWLLMAFGSSVATLITSQLILGLSIGLHCPMVFLLVAEYSDPVYRGAFLGSITTFISIGVLWGNLWGSILSWKMTALLCAMIPFVTGFIIALSPESPSWLASKGRYDEARKVFQWLRGNGAAEMKEIEDLIKNVQSTIAVDNSTSKEGTMIRRNLNKYGNTALIKPIIIAFSATVVNEFSGTKMISAYGNLIFQLVLNKRDVKDITWQLTSVLVMRTVLLSIALILLKYVKRRTIMFTSGFFTILSYFSISFYVYSRKSFKFEGWLLDWLPMSLMFLYIISFNLGLVPLTPVIIGEVFPLAYRSMGSTVTVLAMNVNFVIALKSAPYLYSSIGIEGAFLVYSVILTLFLLVLFILLPETKDRTLLDIENNFKVKNTQEAEVEMRLFKQ